MRRQCARHIMTRLAHKVIDCCGALALCSEEAGRTTRTFLSTPMHEVHRQLGAWMQQLGMHVRVDAAGNLRGVRGSSESPRLVIGSHLDTVPNAGAFDGILGVVLGIALVEAAGDELRLAIEVVGFSDEEGVRFGVPFLGSRALVGTLDQQILERRDTTGSTVTDAIRAFGLDPAGLAEAGLHKGTMGYLEFHIEQGPVLDHLKLPLGVVDAINGQSRLRLTFKGAANHAGTTPMSMRHDALAAASEWIQSVEQHAIETKDLVATVGSLEVEPDASNVIPGAARASLDVRHRCDATRLESVARLLDSAGAICKRRGIGLEYELVLDQAAVILDPKFRELLARAVQNAGYPLHHMTSGAGHDAMVIAPHVPSAMLFLRSPGGISHHPSESVIVEDVESALKAGLSFVRALETRHA